MSLEAMEWASKYPGLDRGERTILKELANRYNAKERKAWPSMQRLAKDTGYSRSSVCRILKTLEKKGLIIRVRAIDEYHGGLTSNRYFLPLFAPKDVPSSSSAIRVDRYFDAEGKPQHDDYQPSTVNFDGLFLKTVDGVP